MAMYVRVSLVSGLRRRGRWSSMGSATFTSRSANASKFATAALQGSFSSALVNACELNKRVLMLRIIQECCYRFEFYHSMRGRWQLGWSAHFVGGLTGMFFAVHQDRKSTRLNSSH